jgi:hypothetical protein
LPVVRTAYTATVPFPSVADAFDPGFALFVGGFVAVLFWLAAGLVLAVGPASPVLDGLVFALAGLGGLFLLGGGLLAAALWLLAGR